jgi:hypothetical protein
MPASPATAVELEVARAKAIDRLRSRLAGLCRDAGLSKVPLLALERWRFTCKWAESEGQALPVSGQPPAAAGATPAHQPISSKKAGAAAAAAGGDPVLPFGAPGSAAVAEAGLVNDLVKAGMNGGAAAAAAQALAAASAAAAAAITKLAHQLASGRAPDPASATLAVSFHKHSIDLTAGQQFVMVTREAYGRLARLHRQHAPPGEAAPPVEEPDLLAEAEAADLADEAAGAKGDAPRAAFHGRLFALLLRYKLIQGHGFQVGGGGGA